LTQWIYQLSLCYFYCCQSYWAEDLAPPCHECIFPYAKSLKLSYMVKWNRTSLFTLALRATCFQGKRRCGFPTETHLGTIPRKSFFQTKLKTLCLIKHRYKDGQKWTQPDLAWQGDE